MSLPPFSAMVLAAGFGSRLRPITDEIPKPLLPVGGVPVIRTHLQNLHEGGACRLAVNIHHHSHELSLYIKEMCVEVHVLHEGKIRGTAGGIAGASEFLPLEHPLVVVNGDIVGPVPLAALLEAAHEGLTMVVTPTEIGQGTVGIGDENQVVRLRGQIFGKEFRGGNYVGIACLGRHCRSELPAEGCLVGDWALPALRAGELIRTVTVTDEFVDIGSPATFLEANLRWLSRQPPGSGLLRGAKLARGVQLIDSVVGSGAQIHGIGQVEECVILPGATAQAPLRRCIVTPAGVIVRA